MQQILHQQIHMFLAVLYDILCYYPALYTQITHLNYTSLGLNEHTSNRKYGNKHGTLDELLK
jgi:hypothetical protein